MKLSHTLCRKHSVVGDHTKQWSDILQSRGVWTTFEQERIFFLYHNPITVQMDFLLTIFYFWKSKPSSMVVIWGLLRTGWNEPSKGRVNWTFPELAGFLRWGSICNIWGVIFRTVVHIFIVFLLKHNASAAVFSGLPRVSFVYPSIEMIQPGNQRRYSRNMKMLLKKWCHHFSRLLIRETSKEVSQKASWNEFET